MNEIDCPYCEKYFELENDEGHYYNEDEAHQAECPHCDKKFLVNSSMSWSFSSEKADCLNDGNHMWRKKYNEKYYPELLNREECSLCYEERTLSLK